MLGGTDKTIIDAGGQSSPGVVPYLPLTSLRRERATQQQQPGGVRFARTFFRNGVHNLLISLGAFL